MGLLYPGVDDEDVMQWYLNTHYLDGILDYQPPPSDDDMYDKLLEMMGSGIIDPDSVYTAEEYEAYLDSLPPTTEKSRLPLSTSPAPLSIAYDSYSGSPYTY